MTNSGDGPAKNVVVTDNVCGGASFLKASGEGAFDEGTKQISRNLGELEPGQSTTLDVVIQPGETGTIECRATVKSKSTEPVRAACSTAIEGVPAILVELVDITDPIEVGKEETCEITVTNQGTAVGKDILVKATLPEQLAYVGSEGPADAAADGQVATFAALPELNPKDKVTYRLKVKTQSVGDIRFRIDLTSAQSPEPIIETESTNIFE